MNFLEITMMTLFFILLTPGIICKNIVKNKWWNILLCAILFFISIYVFQWLFDRFDRLENFDLQKTNVPITDSCNSANQYASSLVDKLTIPTISDSSLSITNKMNINSQYYATKDDIVQKAEKYAKNVCKGDDKWTPAPTDYLNNFQNLINNVYVSTTTVKPTTPATTTAKPTTAKPTTVKPTTPNASKSNKNK